MKKLKRISTRHLRWSYLTLTTLAFIGGLAFFSWFSYGKTLIFWLPTALLVLVASFLAYLVKKQLEARAESILSFNTLQQIFGVLIALSICLIVLFYKLFISRDSDVDMVYWLLFIFTILTMIWKGVEIYKELKWRKDKDSKK